MGSKTYKLVSVVSIDNLKIIEDLGPGFRVDKGLYLCNSTTPLKPYLNLLQRIAGEAYLQEMQKPGAVFFSSTEHAQLHLSDGAELIEHLNQFLCRINHVLTWLWLVKDNAVYPACGYVFAFEGNKEVQHASNYIGDHYTLAVGGYGEPTIVSREELDETLQLIKQLLEDRESPAIKVVASGSGHTLIPNKPEVDRISRCFNAISSARAATYFPQKITEYITALETLFSTSSSELTYRLSERVAFFLGETPDERLRIFERMKDAYSVRSSTVHGATLAKKFAVIETLADLSRFCDETLRKSLERIFRKSELGFIFADTNKGNEKIDDFFSKLIFGDPSAQDLLESEIEAESAEA